jgi:hypothetical protein
MQQHLSSDDMVTPPPESLPPAFLKQEGRNTTASLQYKKGGREKYNSISPLMTR